VSRLAAPALVACIALAATPRPCSADASSPFGLAARLESRIAAGDGIMLPDAALELVRFAGTADLADGDWPGEFLVPVRGR